MAISIFELPRIQTILHDRNSFICSRSFFFHMGCVNMNSLCALSFDKCFDLEIIYTPNAKLNIVFGTNAHTYTHNAIGPVLKREFKLKFQFRVVFLVRGILLIG